MAICTTCSKKSHQISWSRHQKGSSGHGGDWNLKAPIHKRTQHPNLHSFKNKKYCTKCLRIVKADFTRSMSSPKTAVAAS